jgi:hypothetical protein
MDVKMGIKRTKKLRCVTGVQKMRWKHMAQEYGRRAYAIPQISHFRVFQVNGDSLLQDWVVPVSI